MGNMIVRGRRSVSLLVLVGLCQWLGPPVLDAQSPAEPGAWLRSRPRLLLNDLIDLPAEAVSRPGCPWLGIGLLATAAGPLFLDESVREAVRPDGALSPTLRDWIVHPFMLERVQLAVGLHAGPAVLLGAGWLTGAEGLTRWGGALLETVLLVDLTVLPMKILTGRPRPRAGPADAFEPIGSVNDAFPSGHTAWAVGIARIVEGSEAPRWIKVLAWAGGLGIVLQRIGADEHWTSDVVVGGLFGLWAGGRVAARYWPRR